MEKSLFCFLCFLLLQIGASEAHFSVGGSVSITFGEVRGAVWIGRGIKHSPPNPTPSEAKLSRVYTALQSWKSAITDDPNKILDTWVGSDVCGYRGVFCVDPQDGLGDQTGPIIAGIDLNHGNLQGTLVKELSLIKDISLLHLNSNRFTGLIPHIFKDLPFLIELDLSNNQLCGPFPIQLLHIPNLIFLDLRFNNFSGPIPEDIFNKRLDVILLNHNKFDGQIPLNLGNSPASVITLANNRFSGNIPFSLANVGPRLKEILFLNNHLTGGIPEGVGLWQDLRVLDVSYNSLSGDLPDSLSCLGDIEVLNLAHNNFSGKLSDSVCSLGRLEELTVASNFFSNLDHECGKLSSRNVHFDFSGNCFPGRNDRQRPEPECSAIASGGSNSPRVPGARPIFCSRHS
ncbi:hypothetical protein Vadar_014943 [Vaccinium darrowii]|uniref:Uncharacterized protein n=1 Tax=Vaccinium darrowii TaxID=229202 RepID=A0ACB7YDU0_9ERIC|nr:hypothetical protein Vadar_014943 [Vaccinium darrowii]